MLTIGTGIGGAILSDGRIFHGAGMAGQLGHITVNAGGHPCKCGRTGCLETESSGTAFQRHVKEAGFAAGTPIADLLSSPEPRAAKVIAAWATPLRAGIDSLVAAFGPELVVLGGGLGAPAIVALERFPATSPWFQYRIAAAELGDEAGVIGAALAALERLR
jgi:glucokinase